MRKTLFVLSIAAVALSATPAPAKTYVCVKWDNGVCVSMHRVKGEKPAAYDVGYVFGPKYAYTSVSDVPQPVVTYYKLGGDMRYVYNNGYLYEVDPSTYAVTKVIDTWSH